MNGTTTPQISSENNNDMFSINWGALPAGTFGESPNRFGLFLHRIFSH